jgi:hypothetical protein
VQRAAWEAPACRENGVDLPACVRDLPGHVEHREAAMDPRELNPAQQLLAQRYH